MDEDPGRPGLEGERVAKAGQLAPDGGQRIGDRVTGIRLVAEDRHRRPLHRLESPGDQRRERVNVAVLGPPDECRLQ